MSVLTIPLTPNAINTVSELAADGRPVASFSDTLYGLTKKSTDPDVQKIAESYIVHYNYGLAIKNASEGIVVMCESRVTLDYIIRYLRIT